MTDDAQPQSARNIKELLLRAVEGGPIAPLGGHSTTNVYSLGPDFPNYLLRISDAPIGFDHSEFLRKLKTSTALTPVSLCDRNFGQPLLQGDIKYSTFGFQIVSRIPGESLQDIYYRHYNILLSRGIRPNETETPVERAERGATLYILQLLNRVPQESLVSLMRNINYLTEHGIQADIQWGNILFNEGAPPEEQLRLIDVNYTGSRPDQPPPEPVLNNLSDIIGGRLLYNFKTKRGTECLLKCTSEEGILEALELKLREAAKEARLPETREEASTKVPKGRTAFSTLSAITTQLGSSITLGQSPGELKEMLCKITPPLQVHI